MARVILRRGAMAPRWPCLHWVMNGHCGTFDQCPLSLRKRTLVAHLDCQLWAINGLMHRSKSSHRGYVRTYYLFTLDLNGNAVVIGGARNDHEVATWDLVLAAHQLADRSDRINDGCARRVGHETLQRP
jgi:hypothetical protein